MVSKPLQPDSSAASIAPWLSVPDGARALEFYKAAFGAVETYRADFPGGLVARLAVGPAEFWLSAESADGDAEESGSAQPVGGGTVRMILTVDDPDRLFAQAIRAGATEIFPVGEQHGWRVGRLADPFGLHWEIGRPGEATS